MSKPSDLVQGTLDLLLLKILALQPLHAWAISQRLKQISGDVLQVSDGSLYPAMRIERWLYTLPLRLRSLFRRDRVEDELDEELRFHIEQLTEQHIARGVPPDEARLAALRAMHGIEQRKEE